MEAPIPLDAPVTIATLSLSLLMFLVLSYSMRGMIKRSGLPSAPWTHLLCQSKPWGRPGRLRTVGHAVAYTMPVTALRMGRCGIRDSNTWSARSPAAWGGWASGILILAPSFDPQATLG